MNSCCMERKGKYVTKTDYGNDTKREYYRNINEAAIIHIETEIIFAW